MGCHTTIDFETAVAGIPEDQELIRRWGGVGITADAGTRTPGCMAVLIG
jgi:hypothetical protein